MLKKLKIKVLNYIKKFLEDPEYSEFSPKKTRNLRAVSFESKYPLGNDKYEEYLFQCTEWNNGEGYDITIDTFNEVNKNNTEKYLKLHLNEIEGIIACLDYMNHFYIDE